MLKEFEITIPFIDKVQVSSTRRKKYFEFKHGIVLPKKYTDKKIYTWKKESKTKKLRLFNKETGLFVIKNNKSLDKPRYFRINGQDIYSGNLHANSRALLVTKLHDWYINVLPLEELKTFFTNPLMCISYEMVFYKTYKDKQSMDVDNHWIYEKCLQDCIVSLKLLEDDSPLFIKSRTSTLETVESEEERKIVIKFKQLN